MAGKRCPSTLKQSSPANLKPISEAGGQEPPQRWLQRSGESIGGFYSLTYNDRSTSQHKIGSYFETGDATHVPRGYGKVKYSLICLSRENMAGTKASSRSGWSGLRESGSE